MNENKMLEEEKIIFCLNVLANIGATEKGTKAELEVKINELLTKVFTSQDVIDLLDSWKVVWGPAVYQSMMTATLGVFAQGSRSPDNTIYMAQSMTSKNKYVVAIAGTVNESWYDWLALDADIIRTIDWPYGDSSMKSGWISEGTFNGLTTLQAVTPTLPGPQKGKSILKALHDIMKNATDKTQIYITGHSLGGALSAVVALWLKDCQVLWDPNNIASIIPHSSAGPTPGNYIFSAYFGRRFEDTEPKRIWNDKDIVPYPWSSSAFEALYNIYKPHLETPFLATVLIGLIQFLLTKLKLEYQQILPDADSLIGKVKIDEKDFLAQVEYQHTLAYIDLLGLQEVTEAVYKATGKKFKDFSPFASEFFNNAIIDPSEKAVDYLRTLRESLTSLPQIHKNR